MNYTFRFRDVFAAWDYLMEGVVMTLGLSAVTMVLGLLIGVACAAGRLYGPRPVQAAIATYVEVIRNTPLLIQLFIVFFGLPGLGLRLDATTAAVISLTINLGAYATEIVRAGLQAIPRGLIEAAAMDGSSVLRRARDIQLPLLAPTLFFLLVINITETFVDSFGIVDITTGGGPARATDLMVYKIYSDGFKGLDYSMAAAQSIVLMALVIGLTFIQFRYVEKRVHYK